jgi:DNA-binding MarR family transcriptional regulator
MPPANIHATVRRLVLNGLVGTRPSESDNRMLLVELTDRGREVLRQVLPGATAANARTLDVLSKQERHTLMRLLDKLVRSDTDGY